MIKYFSLFLLLLCPCTTLFSQNMDAVLQQIHIGRYYQIGTKLPLQIGVSAATNNSGPINQLKVSWSIGTVASGELTATGINIPREYTVESGITIPVPFADSIPLPNTKGRYSFTVNLIEVNGQAKRVIDTRTLSFDIQVMDSLSPKKVLIEEFTGTWCGWCPGGKEIVDQLTERYGEEKIHPVMLHISNGSPADPMETPTTIALGRALGAPFFPSGSMNRLTIDRNKGITYGTGDFESGVFANINAYTPISISFEQLYNPQTRQLTLNGNLTSTNYVRGVFKVNYYIIEDNVTGGREYNQANYLNNRSNSKWYMKGNPIVGYAHQHVLRDAVMGSAGLRIGENMELFKDQVYTIPTQRYTIPQGIKLEDLKIVAFAYNDEAPNTTRREVFDVVTEPLKLTVGNIDRSFASASSSVLSIYPNPADESIQIETLTPQVGAYTVRLMDINGKVIDSHQFESKGNGQTEVVYYNTAELPVGVYLLALESPNTTTQYAKVVISR